jgi:GNAT superfamily N-acetyltransferase
MTDTDRIASWESQVCQYPPTGEPGITHMAPEIVVDGHATTVDCLLYRSPTGELLGIFNHYRANNPRQPEGSCNIWVHPDHQRQGIASALLREAWHRWPLKEADQVWSGAGSEWIGGLVDKGKVDPLITHSLNETFWKEPPPGVEHSRPILRRRP